MYNMYNIVYTDAGNFKDTWCLLVTDCTQYRHSNVKITFLQMFFFVESILRLS